MTSNEKLYALVTAVRYVVDAGIEGDLVECGVWRGGSMHAVARTLLAKGVTDRDLHLFDTFSGMTEPTERDVSLHVGKSASELLETSDRTSHTWAVASREDVEEGLATLDYPQERFHLVEGPVEETIPGGAPQRIALLRLDTDWYESTKHELEHLYDRLAAGRRADHRRLRLLAGLQGGHRRVHRRSRAQAADGPGRAVPDRHQAGLSRGPSGQAVGADRGDELLDGPAVVVLAVQRLGRHLAGEEPPQARSRRP